MAKILIIDDDDDIIDNLTMVLEQHGFTVAVKTDVENLVEEVKQIHPDVIILDVMFPEDPHAGFNAARELHQDSLLRQVPVVVLSAVNQRSGMSIAFSESDISEDFMPVQAFLEKPVVPSELIERINSLLAVPEND